MDGVVTVVQESRFQLTDDAGVSHLFLLSQGAAAEPDQLPPLQRRQSRVRVEYEPAPHLIADVVHAIALCPDPPSKGRP